MDLIKLSTEQEKAVNYSYPGPYAIRGIAGSGKTTVGLHRIPFLLNNCRSEDKILVVTYQKVLVNYIKHLLEKDHFDQKGLNADDLFEQGLITSIDSLVYSKYLLFKNRNANHATYRLLPERVTDKSKLNGIFEREFEKLKVYYPELSNYSLGFLRDEVDYINGCKLITHKEYQVFTRLGRNKFDEEKHNLSKKSRIREAIFRLRKNYNHAMIKEGMIDWPVMRWIALLEVENNPPRNYTHLIVDECQDLDRVRLDFLKHFLNDKPTASATFLYDNTQSIYLESWLGNGQSFSSLGIDIKGRSKILKKNYRTTYEIQEAAQSLLKGSTYVSQDIEPTLINRSGTKPVWGACKSFEHQVDFICDVIKTHSEHFELKDIIVAVRTTNEVDHLYDALIEKGINCGKLSARDNSFKYNQVRVMTIHSSKGLESEVVIIANLNYGIFPRANQSAQETAKELKLLYVGMTRASKHLYLTSVCQPSEFLELVDPGTIDKIDFETYEKYEPVKDIEVRERIKGLVDDLMQILKGIPQETPIIQSKDDYDAALDEMMTINHQLRVVRAEIDELKVDVPANSILHEQYMNLLKVAEKKSEEAAKRLRALINTPLDFRDQVNFIKERFYRFTEEANYTLATIEYNFLDSKIRGHSDQKDWGPILTAYSKALEIELKRIFINNRFKYITKGIQKQNKDLTLSEMEIVLKSKEFPYSYIWEMLHEIKFRELRNDATHSKVIQYETIPSIRDKFMKNEGVFDKINELLN